MAKKKTRRDKAIEQWENYYKAQVFGDTWSSFLCSEILGRKVFSDGGLGFATSEERMDALCRIVLHIAEDVSDIYRAVEAYQKVYDNLEKQFELIRTLAIDKYNLEEAEKAEKAEKRAKKRLETEKL